MESQTKPDRSSTAMPGHSLSTCGRHNASDLPFLFHQLATTRAVRRAAASKNPKVRQNISSDMFDMLNTAGMRTALHQRSRAEVPKAFQGSKLSSLGLIDESGVESNESFERRLEQLTFLTELPMPVVPLFHPRQAEPRIGAMCMSSYIQRPTG